MKPYLTLLGYVADALFKVKNQNSEKLRLPSAGAKGIAILLSSRLFINKIGSLSIPLTIRSPSIPFNQGEAIDFTSPPFDF
ncbi:MAG TPA: hypothetical protein DEG17_04305 [Cyanobacteria bacterium UBA11149]|nr:hypothetical protein [Cyanobacteria bacterium UBA11166]HBR76903.1 hypothetical protein [Cyanobacteria bacterium UBA11159]HBS69247.1 hypothetical protein [Cyanobacteria bacterium UBA11153]HBW88112.1 hypothetical protein [Cyanobacteria bacterium UBA11149]HCA96851.1 hypothetical protein [Cyanobacteria bacterium UBA9226]